MTTLTRREMFRLAVMLVLAATVAASLGVAASPTPAAGPAKPAIIAYVFPGNGLIVPSEIAADKLTHINYAFADVKDGRIVEGFAHDAENFKLLAELRRQHPHLQILISVGGWTWSGNFSAAALTAESRSRFTASAIEFVRRHDIDGVDIDWEYPGLRGNNNVHRPEDKENFTAMMTDLRQALDAEGRARNRRYLLTFAAGAFPDFIAKTEMDKVQAVVDFVNLMTYDFRTSDPIAGHHANLYLHPADTKKRSVDSAVRDFIAAGVPPAKIVVGVPFYGRAWADIKGEGTGLYQPGSRPTERIETKYGPMSTTLIDRGGFVRMWDAQAQAPYLWNKDTHTFISYEDPESLRLKSAYIRDKGLGGAMFWEYYADKTGVLLDTLFTSLHGPAPATPRVPDSDSPKFADVYVSGEAGYHTFRIPAIIATQKGTLLAFAEARRAGAADAGDIDLVVKRSRDGGLSWSPLQVVGDDGANTFGNPCPVLDRKTGALWLLSTHNRGTDREKDIIAGTSQASRTVWAMKTLDDAVTWSAPVEITPSVKQPDWTWYATGPGVGIQTSGGRLVIPANHAEAGTGVHRSHIFYSDDGGGHWTLGASADAGTNESQIVELADGRLMLNMRNHPPKPENFRMVAISADAGRTLSKASPDRALVEPPAQASLVRLIGAKPGDRNLLLFANPASAARERLTVRLSYDEGVTWPVARVVHQGPAAYSSLVALQDSSVGLLFERGERSPYERITFARFSLEWLTEGRTQDTRLP